MRSLLHAVLAFGLLFAPACAERAAPWVNGEALLKATQADVAQSGVKGVAAHAADIERALDEGAVCCPRFAGGRGPFFVLTDGMLDTLVGRGEAAADQKDGKAKGGQTTAVNNPYPFLALYLGSYYNEMQRPEDALRVLDKGLKLMVMPAVASHTSYLASERALSLTRLARLPEALAAYDEGLKLAAIDDKGKARMQRGRGYVFTEMGRLDEAEEAYKESLKLEPGNRIALGELDYIAKLKVGGEKAPGGITLPNATPKTN